MFGYLRNIQLTLDVPAPAAVAGVLLAAALTKGGHAGLAVAGMIALYALCTLHVAIRRTVRGADAGEQPVGA
jgi:hypothetical protein